MSRTTNSLRNAGVSMAVQMLDNLLHFACRTVFIHTLGKEYLGISSLYANVITILSISELGFSTAVTYSLYDPLARDDRMAIRAIMSFFKTAYRVIGLAVLLLGLGLMPFLPKLMNGVTDQVNIYHYYLLYLAETVVSYLFFAYKGTLLVADQKKYAVDLIQCAAHILVALVQICVLLVFKSFLVYTILSIAGHIVRNLTTSVAVDRRYPYLKEPAEKLSRQQKKDIFSRVYAAALYRVSYAVGTATDNLVISSVVSVLAVGMYDNYHMITQIVQKFLTGIFQAMSSSLGNLYATERREKSEYVFRCLNFLNNYLVVTCSVCFLSLFPGFITLWAGPDYLLPDWVTVVIVANFTTNYWQNVVQIFCNASGVFVRGKVRAVTNAVLNLGISIVLAHPLGIAGVLLGSIISRLLTTWWFDAWLVYRVGFGMSPWGYFRDCGVSVLLIAGGYGLVRLVMGWVTAITWPTLILTALAAAVIPTAVCWLLYHRSEEYAYLKNKALSILKRK